MPSALCSSLPSAAPLAAPAAPFQEGPPGGCIEVEARCEAGEVGFFFLLGVFLVFFDVFYVFCLCFSVGWFLFGS